MEGSWPIILEGVDCGRVTASGTHEQLLKDSELYREMWRAHIGAKDGDAA